jgi:hypothetical protein
MGKTRGIRAWFALLSVFALLLTVGVPLASALTKSGAEEWSLHWAKVAGWSNPYIEECTGPYENVEGKTQWACYGRGDGEARCQGTGWQANVGPYGELTYAEKWNGCWT